MIDNEFFPGLWYVQSDGVRRMQREREDIEGGQTRREAEGLGWGEVGGLTAEKEMCPTSCSMISCSWGSDVYTQRGGYGGSGRYGGREQERDREEGGDGGIQR
jgi:hypothetical protein